MLALPAAANAQAFGTAGRFAISAERITTINHSSVTSEDEDEDATTTIGRTNIALFANPTTGPATSGYSFPRIAADYFVIDGLSVGAGLGLASSSGTIENEAGNISVETDADSMSGLLFAPRVGYAFMFEDNIGIWPRAGFTYVGVGTDEADGDEISARLFAFTLEVPFVFVPVPHVAFTAAPALDLGISGSTEEDPQEPGAPNVETDYKVTDIGLHLGMTAYF